MVMFNLVFADILSIIIELANKNTLNIIGEVKTTMAIAALLTNLPILMIYFSGELPNKLNRILNIAVAVLTMVYIVGGGSLSPHYLICAGIELIALLCIIWLSFRWKSVNKI